MASYEQGPRENKNYCFLLKGKVKSHAASASARHKEVLVTHDHAGLEGKIHDLNDAIGKFTMQNTQSFSSVSFADQDGPRSQKMNWCRLT